MQFMDLNYFKNLLYDSCLVYKEISKRQLDESDCYVSTHEYTYSIAHVCIVKCFSVVPFINCHVCFNLIQTCESIDRVDVVLKPEEDLETFTELDWPVEYESHVKTNVSVNEVASVSIYFYSKKNSVGDVSGHWGESVAPEQSTEQCNLHG